MRRTLLTILTVMALSPLAGHAASVTVKPGETLSDIAARYGVSINSLMRLNGLRDPNFVQVGQRLQIPGAVSAGSGRHTVRSGDTLSQIAVQYRVTERQLIVLNGLASADHVEIGQTLKLPSNAVLPQPAPQATARVQPVPIKANPNATSHTVARGQTLTQIAKAYNIPMASLISINAIANPNQVKVGTKLMLRSSQPEVDTTSAAGDSVPAAQASESSQDSVSNTTSQSQPDSEPQANQPVVEETVTTDTVITETIEKEPVATAAASQTGNTSAQPKQAAWRTYGPLQVDWGNWQSMAGSEVAPTLNGEGQSFYVAVNCSAKKINVTGANGMWKNWIAPQTEFERALVKDRCAAIKS